MTHRHLLHSLGLGIILGAVFFFGGIFAFFAFRPEILPTETPRIAGTGRSQSELQGKMERELRVSLVQRLLAMGFTGRVQIPYSTSGATPEPTPLTGVAISLSASGNDFSVLRPIETWDDLDALIQQKLMLQRPLTARESFRNLQGGIWFFDSDLASLHSVYLFKSDADLHDLWYSVQSRRRRVSPDIPSRRYNIAKAFSNLWNVRVIPASGTFNFFDAVHFDNKAQKQFKYGLGIMGTGVIPMYAGGICGSSTALFQGIIGDGAFALTDYQNHSKRYSGLYPATIDGTYISTPGLDSTVYRNTSNFVVTNIRPYPVILIANFDGEKGHDEDVFTLSPAADQVDITYLGKKKSCYTRTRGTGEIIKSCYAQIE